MLVSFDRRKKKRMDSNQDAVFGHTSYEHVSPDSPLNMEDLPPAPLMGHNHSSMLPVAPPC